jgi:hypothetical protein
MAAVGGRSSDDAALRIESVYDEERASLKIILLGDLETVADLLKLIRTLSEVRE